MEQKLDLKKEKVNKIITVILVGLLLLIIVVPFGDDTSAKEGAGTSMDDSSNIAGMEGNASYYEERLKDILEKSYGEGTMEVMVHMREDESTDGMYEENALIVDGILIVADVSDAAVADISFAVCALFDLPAHKVAVIKK